MRSRSAPRGAGPAPAAHRPGGRRWSMKGKTVLFTGASRGMGTLRHQSSPAPSGPGRFRWPFTRCGCGVACPAGHRWRPSPHSVTHRSFRGSLGGLRRAPGLGMNSPASDISRQRRARATRGIRAALPGFAAGRFSPPQQQRLAVRGPSTHGAAAVSTAVDPRCDR